LATEADSAAGRELGAAGPAQADPQRTTDTSAGMTKQRKRILEPKAVDITITRPAAMAA
jgi:hypothetical protein